MKNFYYDISDFELYKQKLIKKKVDFEVVKTTYTRRITTKTKRIVFNEGGEKDNVLLSLIGMVRKDALEFIDKCKNDSYIHFFDIIEKPRSKKVLSKIDLKSAYWNYAIKKGIIKEKTNEFLIKEFSNRGDNSLKKARLKALGSLATTKTTEVYEKGVLNTEKLQLKTEPTKDIYMDICRGIDSLMRECVNNVKGCIYYYWDCIFISEEFEEDAIEFFKSYGYQTSTEKTTLESVRIGRNYYLLSSVDDKMYMVRRENAKYILDNKLKDDEYESEIYIDRTSDECKKEDIHSSTKTDDIFIFDEGYDFQEECPF
jgi:hypothetical protein